jgi:LCP family protein required for cell wall assembly
MKPTEITPIGGTASLGRPHRDRLTLLLIWLVFFLVAALAAIATDLWLRPVSQESVVEALGLTPSSPTLAPSPMPTETPTVAVAFAAISATVEFEPPGPVAPPACVPPDDWGIHLVQQGNTLYSLAQRYGTDVDTLMHVNCLNTHTIFSGQRLYVPGPPANMASPTPFATQRPAPTSTPRPGASVTPMAELAAVATLLPTLTPQPAFSLTIPDRYLNIVLLGSDKRPGSGAWRTDSMIIVSVDTASNVVRLLSIPRDLWVYIPGHGYNRINTADLWGELAKKGSGPDRVKQTIHHNLGIPIHYYVRVDFQGFIQIIDTVGGIDVDVDCPLPDIKLSAGMHHMSGNEALRYARSRYSTNDFDRGRRQRKVLMALWDQALTLDIIPRLPQLWWTMANSFQTDLTLDQVINLAYVGVQLKPQRILSRAIGPRHVQSWITPQGAAVLLPNHQEIRAMLESFYAPVDTTRLDAADKVSVQLLNGSSRQDADQLAASTLRWAGFKVASAGPADRQDYAQTQIAVYSGDMTIAEQIAGELRISSAVIQDLAAVQGSGAPANPVEIQVILGRDYDPCQR